MQDWMTTSPSLSAGQHLELMRTLQQRSDAGEVIFPPRHQLFKALMLTPLAKVKVVILGQDPYHGQGQAHGLAFSVPNGIATPPSLRNIQKEIAQDIYPDTLYQPQNDLSPWAQQGVLLLNATLSVVEGQAGSHQHLGWQSITDDLIRTVNAHHPHIVFMLWGKHAQAKAPLITGNHLVLQAPHPSPLSAHRGFLGCGHFSQANAYLMQHQRTPIVW